jgi:hypothetical protein
VVVKGNGDIFIMYMIKLKDLLVEAQTFNFNKNKTQIMQLIKMIKNGEEIDDSWSEDFYNILRNRDAYGSGHLGLHKTMGFKDDAPPQWEKFFKHAAFNPKGFPHWAQRDFNRSKNDKQDGKAYNFYITVDTSDKNNVARFVNNYIKLDNSLKQFSDDKKVPISYKTHAELDSFLADNDSLKVYYYDPSLKSDVENIVKKWARDNSINLSNRSHEHGVDMNGKSYGEIVAATVLNTLVDTIKSHPNHSNEEYYQWLVKHFIDIIKSIKVK